MQYISHHISHPYVLKLNLEPRFTDIDNTTNSTTLATSFEVDRSAVRLMLTTHRGELKITAMATKFTDSHPRVLEGMLESLVYTYYKHVSFTVYSVIQNPILIFKTTSL